MQPLFPGSFLAKQAIKTQTVKVIPMHSTLAVGSGVSFFFSSLIDDSASLNFLFFNFFSTDCDTRHSFAMGGPAASDR
jgi:hypothetical protein